MNEPPDTDKDYNSANNAVLYENETDDPDSGKGNGIYFLLILSVLIIFALSFISI